jgi:2-polyprenyl-3-methyl-5-hydroxy-6-metoxy-1,4-benzoquinol methylase
MKKINTNKKKFLMQKYLYDNKLNKIKYNLDAAYKNIDKLWCDQLDVANTRYNFITGDILSSYSKKIFLNILDIGCGYGAFVNYLNSFQHIDAYGIDASRYAINLGKKKYKFKNLKHANINNIKINFSIKFDVITILGVFWFMLEDFKNCFNQLKKIVKKNGKIYFQINIPKDNNIFSEKIKDYSDLYNFISKFFVITNFINYEQKTSIKKKLKIINQSCLITCRFK